MFDLYSWWSWAFLVLTIAAILVFDKYRTKKLPPRKKELQDLYSRLIIFGVFTVFLTLALPGFYGDYVYIPDKVNDLETAQKILQDLNNDLKELKEDLKVFRYIVYTFFLFFTLFLLPAIYNFAKAITSNEESK